MGKLFGKKRRYSDDEYDNEEFDDEMFEDDEDIEDDEDEEDGEEIDIDEDDEEIGEEEMEEDDEDDEIDEDEDDEDDEDDEIDEDEDDEDEDDEEWEEDERRIFRHRRRIRNQIIAYSVVLIFLAVVLAGCIMAGRSIAGVAKAKKAAKEQAELQARLQEEEEAQEARDTVIDTPEPMEEEVPEEDYLGEIVEAYLSEMPLNDKIAGLFLVQPEAITGVSTATQAGDGTREALNDYAVGGLVYSKKNILDKEQFIGMLSNTASMSRYPVFLGIEEEGGSSGQVAGSSIEVVQVDDMSVIGESGDASQAYESGMMMGGYLKELGFNLNLAPVADVVDGENNVLGSRSFGSDAQIAGEMVANLVEGMEGAGVSSCLKYFPGSGGTEGDTRNGRVETTKTLEEMRNYEFIPYQAGIEAGADFVMVGHITASAVDEKSVPSSLSEVVITDILRNELGFQGVIITDALNVSAITEYYTSEQAAVMAIQAGADMLLMPEDFQTAYEALLAAVQEGTISEARIDESLERIFRVKCAEKLE